MHFLGLEEKSWKGYSKAKVIRVPGPLACGLFAKRTPLDHITTILLKLLSCVSSTARKISASRDPTPPHLMCSL